MPTSLKLNPFTTPKETPIADMPNGVGLNIIFRHEGQEYVLAGPRTKKVLTVNGGKIAPDVTMIDQLIEEMFEETFGVMTLAHTDNQLSLIIDEKVHPLKLVEDKTCVDGDGYTFVTFTAICKTVSLDQLKALATQLTPTAAYWNQFGNFLFGHFRALGKASPEAFNAYWTEHLADLTKFLTQIAPCDTTKLLIKPTDVFAANSDTEALENFRNTVTKDLPSLIKLFTEIIGRYSERSGYYVFSKQTLEDAAKNKSKNITDIQGNIVAEDGVFNKDYVAHTYPQLKPPKQRPGLFVPVVPPVSVTPAPVTGLRHS